jgi:hypothetical protein
MVRCVDFNEIGKLSADMDWLSCGLLALEIPLLEAGDGQVSLSLLADLAKCGMADFEVPPDTFDVFLTN